MEPVEGVEAPCPLCGEAFTDDAAYAGHLADAHGLVDDDGAETTVEHALVVSGIAGDRELAEAAAEEAAASKAIGNGEAETTVHPSRIYDPRADDSRLRPLVLGMAGLLLLGALGIGLAAGLGGNDDAGDGDEVATADGDDDGAVAGGGAAGGSTTVAGDVTVAADPALTTVTEPVTDPSVPTTTGGVPPPTSPTTAAPPTTARPVVTAPPTTPPPTNPPTTAPPTTAPTTAPPTTVRPFVAPAMSGARIDSCQRSGPDGTWTFSYVLSGGSQWAPSPSATAVGGGRYSERRTGKASQGFPSTSIQIVDQTTGQVRSITLSPSIFGAPCR